MSPSIHTSISISLGASSIAHTPCHSISHPCSPITISRGSLHHKHTHSCSTCLHFLHTSLSTSVPCLPNFSWPRARGLSLSVAEDHTLSPHLCSTLEDACMICSPKKRKNTHTLSNLSFVVTFSFTHILFLHTYSFSFTRT